MKASLPARRSLSASALGGSAEAEAETEAEAEAEAAGDFFFFLAMSPYLFRINVNKLAPIASPMPRTPDVFRWIQL